jgi:hypothetical protein
MARTSLSSSTPRARQSLGSLAERLRSRSSHRRGLLSARALKMDRGRGLICLSFVFLSMVPVGQCFLVRRLGGLFETGQTVSQKLATGSAGPVDSCAIRAFDLGVATKYEAYGARQVCVPFQPRLSQAHRHFCSDSNSHWLSDLS